MVGDAELLRDLAFDEIDQCLLLRLQLACGRLDIAMDGLGDLSGLFKFLVLGGDSRLGRLLGARTLFPPGTADGLEDVLLEVRRCLREALVPRVRFPGSSIRNSPM
ncbi:hypothetical protein DB35_15940 [Streptomyces abyssalis]|uniref:Uncharacterized protein n=1 Tax=Streptomyces abyssalis TaxID=933944 RepID=A0A1E7JFP9_9ACTN|nr:hypothetical protein AN215_22075 [Streptomyces abyssalis]OEU91540.1 hypothetical protein DB35_15940 [Streptomyces abyssalis]